MRIQVIAQDGHFRDSLVALLRAQPGAEITALKIGSPRHPEEPPPDIVLVDMQADERAFSEALVSWKGECDSARYVALVDNVGQTGVAYALGADYALARSASASELLLAVQRLRQFAPQVITGIPNPAAP